MVFLGYRAKRPWRPEPAWDPEAKTGALRAWVNGKWVREDNVPLVYAT